MEKKTKQLVAGDMVKNLIDGKFYTFECLERSGAGYIVKMTPSTLDGNSYYADHSDRHVVQA